MKFDENPWRRAENLALRGMQGVLLIVAVPAADQQAVLGPQAQRQGRVIHQHHVIQRAAQASQVLATAPWSF